MVERLPLNADTISVRTVIGAVEGAEVVISNYEAFLEAVRPDPNEIYDADRLPYPKAVILDAYLLVLSREADKLWRTNKMQLDALALAQFQGGVGHTPLRILGLSTRDLQQLRHDPAQLAKRICEASGEGEKYQQFVPKLNEDSAAILAMFQRAGRALETPHFGLNADALQGLAERASRRQGVAISTSAASTLTPNKPKGDTRSVVALVIMAAWFLFLLYFLATVPPK